MRGLNGSGTAGPEASSVYTLDTTGPPAPAVTSAPAAQSPDAAPTYAFTAEAGATTQCRLERGATVVSAWSACTSPRTYD
ncbi:MAG: hypothetical protein M3389_07980, partial [Actinomycetota bacterium]|nr:hypothetical protein [Actinomycetota bacterium]